MQSAKEAAVDPALLLAVLFRESGDQHLLDWLSVTPVAMLHEFSIGLSNMRANAFDEARDYANGAIRYDWSATQANQGKAIQAAAFLLAKRRSQLDPLRSNRFTDAQYVRLGYRSGYKVMRIAEQTGSYGGGLELFDIAYRAAGQLIRVELTCPTCLAATHKKATGSHPAQWG